MSTADGKVVGTETAFIPRTSTHHRLRTPAMSTKTPEANSATNGEFRVLPSTAREYPAMLVYERGISQFHLGDVDEDLESPAPVLIRLGTKVSDLHPSCVGFRIMIRNRNTKALARGAYEECYYIVSYKFQTENGTLEHAPATKKDLEELYNTAPLIGSTPSLSTLKDKKLHRLDFEGADAFEITRHGIKPDGTNADVALAMDMRPLNGGEKMSIFFPSDDILVKQLEEIIKQGCVGKTVMAWHEVLPPSAELTWPGDEQSKMVAGSTDLLNVLQKAARQLFLYNADGTALRDRPKAQKFKAFIQAAYPTLTQESRYKVFPVMLNVTDAMAIDLPFGLSFINRQNTIAAVHTVHKMLKAGIRPADIGIVAFYPSQAEIYKSALAECHKYKPSAGYDLIKADVLEEWVGKETEFAIVDLVRTANASGQLGHLSQARRMKVALTIHRNGLVLVGDRKCTDTADGPITSTKLEKLFQWLEDNDRTVNIQADRRAGSDTSKENKPPAGAHDPGLSKDQNRPGKGPSGDPAKDYETLEQATDTLSLLHLSKTPNSTSGGRDVGVPGLECYGSASDNSQATGPAPPYIEEPASKIASESKDVRGTVKDSSARLSLLSTGASDPSTSTSRSSKLGAEIDNAGGLAKQELQDKSHKNGTLHGSHEAAAPTTRSANEAEDERVSATVSYAQQAFRGMGSFDPRKYKPTNSTDKVDKAADQKKEESTMKQELAIRETIEKGTFGEAAKAKCYQEVTKALGLEPLREKMEPAKKESQDETVNNGIVKGAGETTATMKRTKTKQAGAIIPEGPMKDIYDVPATASTKPDVRVPPQLQKSTKENQPPPATRSWQPLIDYYVESASNAPREPTKPHAYSAIGTFPPAGAPELPAIRNILDEVAVPTVANRSSQPSGDALGYRSINTPPQSRDSPNTFNNTIGRRHPAEEGFTVSNSTAAPAQTTNSNTTPSNNATIPTHPSTNTTTTPATLTPQDLQAQYHLLRTHFTSLHRDAAPDTAYPHEDRLFRQLAEACMIGDQIGFFKVQMELMGLVIGLSRRGS